MHISKEFLMEAVGLALLVALILIGMQLFQKAVQVTSLLEQEQKQKISELEEYEIIQFDGLQMDGMTAISYIKKMIGTYNLPVCVDAGSGEFMVTGRNQYSRLREPEDEMYMNPLAMYRCVVSRDANEVITGVSLTIQAGGN